MSSETVATHEGSTDSNEEIWLLSAPDTTNPFDHPMARLRSLLGGLCLPRPQQQPQQPERRKKPLVEAAAAPSENCTREIRLVPSLDSDESTHLSSSASQKDEEEDEEEEEEEEEPTECLVVTKPGTSRAVRIYRGVETFVSAVMVVAILVYLLKGFEVHFEMEMRPSEGRDASLFATTPWHFSKASNLD